jgi:hypothetical protein
MDNSIQPPAPPSMTDVTTTPSTTTTTDNNTLEAMTADTATNAYTIAAGPSVNPTPPPLAVDANPVVAPTVDTSTTNVVFPPPPENFQQPPPTPEHQQLQAPQPQPVLMVTPTASMVSSVASTPDSSVHHHVMNGTTTNNHNNTINGMDPRRAAVAVGAAAAGGGASDNNSNDNFGGSDNAYVKNAPPPNAFPQLPPGTHPIAVDDNNHYDDDDEYQEDDDFQDVDFDGNKLPLGVPSEDGDDDQDNQHHSLPASEEVKIALAARNNRTSSFFSRNPKVTFGIVFGIIFVIILGLSLGLTKDQRYEKRTASFHGGDDRLSYTIDYLIRNGVASLASFTNVRSPQYQAVDWMAHDDELELLIPKLSPADSDEAYDFITRYVMAVVYYATAGKDWKHDLSFLSKKKTCEWYQVFPSPVGQVGVLCNQSTRQIVGVSFSKFHIPVVCDRIIWYTSSQYLFLIANVYYYLLLNFRQHQSVTI